MRFSKHFIFSFGLIALFATNCFPFDDQEVHPKINEAASDPTQSRLDEVLKRIGLPNGIDEFLQGANGVDQEVYLWIRQGGTDEDSGFRFLNHFHDPTQPWDNAGIWREPIDDYISSSLVWAQEDQRNDATWNAARSHFYQALATGSEQEYAETFLALGQIMHLVSDKAVPAHVRNDSHLETVLAPILDITHFEVWAARQAQITNGLDFNGVGPGQEIFSHAVGNQSSRISALWDTDRYDIDITTPNPGVTLEPIIGLAEYTNANFFSEGTAFSTRYPFPNYPEYDSTVTKETIEINLLWDEKVNRKYWMKNDLSDNSWYKLAGVSYNTFWTENLYIDGFKEYDYFLPLDRYVFDDYADRLVPRAVGYSSQRKGSSLLLTFVVIL